MKDVDGRVDYLLGWWLIGILIVGIVFLAFYFIACSPSISSALPINTNISNKIFSTEATIVFEEKIKPYIEIKFGEDISDEYLIVQRKLLRVQLFRVEIIGGMDVYSVHLDFVVRIKDRDSGFEHTTLRGQESLFLIKNGKIKDIKPFDEYVVEKDGEEIRKYLDSPASSAGQAQSSTE